LPSAEPAPAAGAIVVVAYQGEAYLSRALTSCRDRGAGTAVYVVDNASTDGSRRLVASHFPEATLLAQPRNRGFGGGCNVGIRAARAAGAAWVLLLNQDAELGPGMVAALARFLDRHPGTAAVQPAVMRDDGLADSLGNPFHYLGFSVAGGNGMGVGQAERNPMLPWLRDGSWRTTGVSIPAFSGAAVMLRMTALDDVGLFEEDLFLYHEDLELGLRLRRAGWTLHLLGSVTAVHHYEFSRNRRKWYYLERNRHWMLLLHYSGRSLAVLAVPLVSVEAAVWAMALRQGWAGEKWASYTYWLRRGRLTRVLQRRREHALRGGLSDAELLAPASGRLEATEASGPLITVVVNPVSVLLWRFLRRFLR
jgi:GT2 family glycosyltransferase